MFRPPPQKSVIGQIGDAFLALAVLPILGIVWITSKVIGAITDNT